MADEKMSVVEMSDKLDQAIEKVKVLHEVFALGADVAECGVGLAFVADAAIADITDVWETIDAMREELRDQHKAERALNS